MPAGTITEEAGREARLEAVIPRVSQAPGVVTGNWTLNGDSGLSMIVFSEIFQRIAIRSPGGDVEVKSRDVA